MRFRIARIAALVAVFFVMPGCASHADHTKDARSALDAGNTARALALYNKALDVPSAKELPKKVKGDNTLLILDRAMILQALKNYELSSRDLEIADKQIEVLDFSRSTLDDIGKYVFSDSTGPYAAPIYEKLMINTMNMVNYLVRRDLNGARIEARRLSVMQRYVKDTKGARMAENAPGSYLAGFIFEKSNDPDTALRYYDEALQQEPFASLEAPIVRLARQTSYRTPRVLEILKKRESRAVALTNDLPAGGTEIEPASDIAPVNEAPSSEAQTAPPAEILVVINYGRVPAKIARRIPIGLALTYASGALSPNSQAQANRLALQGLVTWVNYPELGRARGSYATPQVLFDGSPIATEQAAAVDLEAKKAWDKARGAVVASAITRLIARVVAGETAGQVSGGGTLGAVVSLFTQATLTATDTPDTRNWATLPARVAVARFEVEPGVHTLSLDARERREQYKVDIKPGDWAVLNLTVLR